jgi:leucyl aminopeptidase (aminopeptidase T)
LGIGINPGALLIGSTIMDEKVLGTAHIGIGSNFWFGGEIKTVFHGDQIFKNPQIFINGERISV